MGEFKSKPSLTLRAAFLLRLAREGRKQESTRSQQAHKGYDAQENVHGGQLGLQHLARDNECEKLQDSHQIVGDEGADQFHADDQQEDTVHQFVERLRAAPIHARQRDGTLEAKDNDAEENAERQKTFERCRERFRTPDYTFIHAECTKLDKLSARFECRLGVFMGFTEFGLKDFSFSAVRRVGE